MFIQLVWFIAIGSFFSWLTATSVKEREWDNAAWWFCCLLMQLGIMLAPYPPLPK